MTDIQVPLILAVVSLAGTIITTVVTTYITWFSEEHKARREANKILLKYRDPLLLSATDLQARCYGICDRDILDFKHKDVAGDDTYKDTLYIYTAYVIGQYLSWVWILRRQAQFVALVSSSTPKWNFLQRKTDDNASSLMQKIENIKAAFNSDTPELAFEKPFLMFKAHQQIIGEIMSCQDAKGEYYCMGFATFTERWKNGHPENLDDDGEHKGGVVDHDRDHAGERMAGVTKISDQAFRNHFRPIEVGIDQMYERRMAWKELNANAEPWNQRSDGRLRRLQHLLLDLMDHLDTTGTMVNTREIKAVKPPPNCNCSLHPCHCDRGCASCVRNKNSILPSKRATHCNCDKCVGPLHRHHAHSWSEALNLQNIHETKKDAVAGATSVDSSHEKNGAQA